MEKAVTRSANPDMFIIERDFDHPLSLLYWAFTDLPAKREWYGGEGSWEVTDHSLDFHVGGHELWRGRPSPEANWMTSDTAYYDILPDERLILGFIMTMDGKLFTASQQILEFSAKGAGSHLKLTEQIIYVDGIDHPEDRRKGTNDMMETLNTYLNTVKEKA